MAFNRWSKETIQDRFEAQFIPEPNSGCWLWTEKIDRDGYGRFCSGNGETRRAHRFSWELKFGYLPSNANVCHRCDMPSCVNPDHLFLGSHADNQKDKFEKNRSAKGEKIGASKFDECRIREMRHFRKLGLTFKALSNQFGCSASNAHTICSHQGWKHIKEFSS